MNQTQVVEDDGDVGVVGAERALPELEGLFVEGARLVVVAAIPVAAIIAIAGACGEVRESNRDGAPPSADAARNIDGAVTGDASDIGDAGNGGEVFDDEVVVTHAGDGEPGSLRQLIQDAEGNTLVTFGPELPSTLVFTEGAIELDGSITVAGPGADVLALTTEGRAVSSSSSPGATWCSRA